MNKKSFLSLRFIAALLLTTIMTSALLAQDRKHSLYSPQLTLLAETALTADPSPQINQEYIWFGDMPVAQFDGASSLRWTLDDHLATPILQTNASAAVVWRAEYEPFGPVWTIRNGQSLRQPLRFPGQEDDGATGTTYNINRWYRQNWGRYTQSDPIGMAGGANLYAYPQTPNRFIDPLGLCKVELHFSPLGKVPRGKPYYHAYVVTSDASGTNYFRGGPSANGPGSGSGGAITSGGGGSSSGACCGSSGSNSSNSSSPGSGRGGPDSNNGPWGPIVVQYGAYLPGTIDYPQAGVVEPRPVVLLNDDSPCGCNQCFENVLNDIENRQVPYNPFQMNSNTVVKEILHKCGLSSGPPPYWAPAWENDFPDK